MYLSYGFRSLFSRTYEHSGQPELIVEVFDMAVQANAFGVFAHKQRKHRQHIRPGQPVQSRLAAVLERPLSDSLLASPGDRTFPQTCLSTGRSYRPGHSSKPVTLPGILKLLPNKLNRQQHTLFPSSYLVEYLLLYSRSEYTAHRSELRSHAAQYEQEASNPLLCW